MDRLNVLGVGVSALNLRRAIEAIDRWIMENQREYVCVSGVHGIMESRRDDRLRQIHNGAGLVTPDGMPLVWLLRLAGYKDCDRVCGRDLMLGVFDQGSSRNYRHFLYGSTPRTIDRLEASLRQRFRRARIVGAYCPPFRSLTPTEDQAAVDAINRSSPDIVWVGLSTPKQERWMAEHCGRLDAKVLVGVGAAFDFLAGQLRVPPRAIQRCGLEWAFRLAMEPRRLWRRYLKNNPLFVASVVAQQLNLLRSEIGLSEDADRAVTMRPHRYGDDVKLITSQYEREGIQKARLPIPRKSLR